MSSAQRSITNATRMSLDDTLLLCGVLSPALYGASDLVAARHWHGYSLRHQTISELNAFGSPSRPITIAFGMAIYAALIAFGVGIRRTTSRGQRGLRRAGALLVALGALSLWAVPFASMRVRGAKQGPLHFIGGSIAVPMIVSAMLSSATGLGPRFRRSGIAAVAVMLTFGGWSARDSARIGAGLPTPWVGVKERIGVYAYQLWFAALALALLARRRRAASEDSPA